MNFTHYQLEGLYDELLTSKRRARPGAERLIQYLKHIKPDDLCLHREAAEHAIKAMGITFTIYSQGENIDRQWPFDIIPRIIPQKEWLRIEQGLKQRLTALNCFVNDIYNKQQILKDKVIPPELLKSSANFRKQCHGMEPVFGVWAHICGSDLIRDSDGTMYVLEDNLRVPSGVSYMLENRKLTKRVFPELFEEYNILPTDDYASNLLDTLSAISPL